MNHSTRRQFLSFLLLAVFFICSNFIWQEVPHHLRIRLRWNKAYEGESWKDIRTGMAWSLSYLGAALPPGSLDSSISRLDSSLFELDLAKLGFSEEAKDPLKIILDSLKQSGEYAKQGSIDLGRFFVLTLHSSWHYYAITGAKKKYSDFLSGHELYDPQLVYSLLNSGVAKHNRVIKFNSTTDLTKMAFIAEESEGSILNNTFKATVFEVFDVMPNGQLRFAIYDDEGDLIPASPQELGNAGKPSKCLWCHESKILPLFAVTEDVPASMSAKTFAEYVIHFQAALDQYRQGLKSEIDYSQTQDHAFSELIYISFMEPSLARTRQEWDLADSTELTKLSHLSSHVYEEFPVLGNLFHRNEVDSLSPYRGIRVPYSVREPNSYEPDFTGMKD